MSPSLDTPGFIGREVSTISALWEAISGQAAGVEGNGTNPRPVRFGVLPDSSLSGMASKVRDGFAGVVGHLRAKPHTVTETPPVDLELLRRHYLTIIGWEGSSVHGGLVRLAPELYDDEIRQRISDISGVIFHDYLAALNAAVQQRDDLVRLFDDYDVLVSPTLAIETPRLGQRTVEDDSGLGQVWGALAHFTSPWNVVGFPAISLPIPGAEHPAPVGLQLIGKPHHDQQLLQIAQQVEDLLRCS